MASASPDALNSYANPFSNSPKVPSTHTSLLRLQQQGWIASKWGTSENNRRARFYSITKRGLKQLTLETENWQRISGVIGRVLSLERQG